MNLWLRMSVTLLRGSLRPRCRIDATSTMDFRVWPWEAEWQVISHASLLTLLDMARQDHMQRTGFLRLLLKHRWFLPVAAVQVSFRRPILRFDRVTVTTRVPYWDDKGILVEREVLRDGKPMASAVVRAVIKQGRDTVDPREIVAALGGGAVDEAAAARLQALMALERATAPASAH
jgi:acyl-CoA thioesterase FadM